MGKRDNWKGKDTWKAKTWEESPPWSRSLWRGAKPTRDAGQKPWKDQGPHFPAYDAGWEQPQEMIEISSSSTPARPDGLVRMMQDAINAVRKADNRVGKLKAEQHAKAQRWTVYVQKMQQAYVAERREHLAAVEKMSQELAEAQTQQATTREVLAQAAMGISKPLPVRESVAAQEWVQLMNRAQENTVEAMDIDAANLGQQISELLKPPVAQVSFPTFGLGTAASVPTGTTAAAPAANLQEAFNQLAPGLGDVIAAANAKKEGTATAVIGQTGHVDQGGHVNAPVRPLRPYHATSPRARVDPYPAFSPGQPGCGIARPLVAYPDQCAGVGRHADEPKRRCPFAGPRCA